ncbi:MAG: ABC transporter substrate-binding protein, partial [Planctomycetota bacterium]
LWNNAIAYAKDKNREAALAMLEELRRYAPEYKRSSVIGAIDATLNTLLGTLITTGKLDLGRKVLARLAKDYQGERISSIPRWEAEFLKMAKEKRKLAIAARDRKDYRLARKYARESYHLEPKIEGGLELIKEIDTIYPLVNVGVLQTASVFDPTRIDNWAARRSGRLLYRTLFEMQEAGPEGGEYKFLFGDTEFSPSRIDFDLLLTPSKLDPPLSDVNGFYLADVLAGRAQDSSDMYFSPWAAAINTIGLLGPKQIRCSLRRPHVLPECLLQVTVDGSWFGGEPASPTGDYRTDSMSEKEVRFVLVNKPKTATKPREIVETHCESASTAVAKLISGEVDVLDQLFPADAIRLKASKKIRVANYPLPSVHILVPCSDHPFLAERTFRRGLTYGINREDILKGELLEQQEQPGCQVISGPFPAGVELNDPLGYAYNKAIKPRRFEPSLAKLLITMNRNQMQSEAERKEEVMPEETPLRLAFPPSNLARVACEAIKANWEMLDLEVELVELPVGRTYPDEGTADIVYISAAVWEPIIDARRLLGPEGLAKSSDQLVGLGLRRLEEARDWKSVADALKELHSTTHHELPIIPLWQMVDFYAYRNNVIGVGSDIVSLYQNADKWFLQQ